MAMSWEPHIGLSRLAQGAAQRPWRFIAALVLVTLAAAPGLGRLQFRTDGHALMPQDDPVVRFDSAVRRDFDLRDPIVVLVESSHPEGVFNRETLERVKKLSDAFAGIEGIGRQQITSLATEKRDRFFPGSLAFRPFLDPLPDTPVLMSLLKSDLESTGILEGILVSADGKATAILIGAPAAFDDEDKLVEDRSGLYREVTAIARRFETETDRIFVGGAPVAESLLGRHILEDLRLLIPLSLLLIALACWWGCRRVASLLVVLPKIAAALVWTFGLMGWLQVPVYLTTAVLPVVLVTAFLADEIHLLWHYQQCLARAPGTDHRTVLARAIGEMARPITLTSLTTAAGFLSFLTSSIVPIWTFGLFAGLAILFCLIWSFTVVPATLALLGRGPIERPAAATHHGSGLVRFLAPWFERRRAALACIGLVTVALGLGIGRLEVQDSWVDGFGRTSPFRIATDRINAQLFGSHLLLAEVRFQLPEEKMPEVRGRRGPLLGPEYLRAVGDFESFLRSQPGVGGVVGPYSHFTAVAFAFFGRQPAARSVPDELERVEQIYRLFDRNRGEHRRRQIVNDALDRGIVTIFLKDANYQETDRLMTAVRRYESEHLIPLGARVGFAGDVAVSQAMIPLIVRSQVWSLLFALVGSFLVVCWLQRSFADGFWALLPANVAVVWVFGAMGLAGIHLGVATSMFCAITLGVGADYGIHFLDRFRAAQAAGDASPHTAALAEAGPAIVIDAVAIAVGFSLLALSEVPANVRLGLLVAVALGASCVLTLAGLSLVLPARVRSSVRAPGAVPVRRTDVAG
jgi:predicted RND superfamily exporter protein